MTVCIAALCDRGNQYGPMAVCAADRMLTAGDIQFQPPQPKIFQLTSSITLLYAGDSAMHAEILQQVWGEVNARIQQTPDKWLEVREVADLYAKHTNEARFKKAAQRVLAPLGLDAASFMQQQKDMEPNLVRMIATELLNCEVPEVEAIITGRDDVGHHVYVIYNGDVSCRDLVGFASIGVGSWHANSHFMLAEHTGFAPFAKTLLSTYTAKKHAEVAPGVGEATDMVVIGPQLGASWPIPDELHILLDRAYQDMRRKGIKATQKAEGGFESNLEKLVREAAQTTQSVPNDSGGNPPSDQ